MNENRLIELLTRKAAREISEAELRELEYMLEQCTDAAYYEAFMKKLWKKRKGETDYKVMFEKHLDRHEAKLFTEEGSSARIDYRKRRLHSISRKMVVAASLVLMAALSYVIFQYRPVLHDRQGETIEFIASKGVKKQLRLPDGTQAWLNSGSKLTYAGDFGKGKTRTVHLEGEAYFDVVKNQKKPFIIETDKIKIRVLGTSFNVKAYPEEDEAETTLISGAIELSVNERPDEKIVMKPNEKVQVARSVVNGGSASTRKSQLSVIIGSLSKVNLEDKEYIQEASWIDNRLIFKNESLEVLIPKLERWYNVSIHLDNDGLGGYQYTGSVATESLNETLEALQLIRFFNYKIINNDVTIY